MNRQLLQAYFTARLNRSIIIQMSHSQLRLGQTLQSKGRDAMPLFRDFLDTDSIRKSHFNKYIDFSQQDPEEINSKSLYLQDSRHQPRLHILNKNLQQYDPEMPFDTPLSKKMLFNNRGRGINITEPSTPQGPIVIEIEPSPSPQKRVPQKTKRLQNFGQICRHIERNPYIFIPIEDLGDFQPESTSQRYPLRRRIPPIDYWCEKKVTNNGTLSGILTIRYD